MSEEQTKKKKSDAGRYTPDPDKFRLFGECAGRCSFPGCNENLVVAEGETLNHAQLCHIEGRESDAARHNASLKEVDRYPNLIVLCYKHHHLIDALETRGDFSVVDLQKMKTDALGRNFDFSRMTISEEPPLGAIDDLCRALIENSHPDPSFDDHVIDITKKIHVNKLPHWQSALLAAALRSRYLIDQRLADLAEQDSELPGKIKFRIISMYNSFRAEGIKQEEIIPAFVGCLASTSLSSGKSDTSGQWAAQVVVAYFFETCDILEKE